MSKYNYSFFFSDTGNSDDNDHAFRNFFIYLKIYVCLIASYLFIQIFICFGKRQTLGMILSVYRNICIAF